MKHFKERGMYYLDVREAADLKLGILVKPYQDTIRIQDGPRETTKLLEKAEALKASIAEKPLRGIEATLRADVAMERNQRLGQTADRVVAMIFPEFQPPTPELQKRRA